MCAGGAGAGAAPVGERCRLGRAKWAGTTITQAVKMPAADGLTRQGMTTVGLIADCLLTRSVTVFSSPRPQIAAIKLLKTARLRLVTDLSLSTPAKGVGTAQRTGD
ncbi:unnamed protein product [Protopolystoma xenopodis]|uniref:Uncharacterized protein n=1 Tax=Protopolystoma xenopodis TaxID=117903 RepID=A0A448XR84_9PLAT|nr:unnamed protein product [Protopolystoma xenopodis]